MRQAMRVPAQPLRQETRRGFTSFLIQAHGTQPVEASLLAKVPVRLLVELVHIPGDHPGMVADVQAWVDNSSGNFWWLLKSNESANRTAKRFGSRENSTANQPELTVGYTPLQESADLAVSKTVAKSAPKESESITYTITLTNNGPDDATGVSISDTLPGGVTLASATAGQGSYASGVWTVGTISNGAQTTLTINATVKIGTLGTTIANTASISASDLDDPVSTNNSSSINSIVVTESSGDVDDNGRVGITDVLAIIDIIFGDKTPTTEGFDRANVDMSNQQIDITDLLSVIDIIFGQ